MFSKKKKRQDEQFDTIDTDILEDEESYELDDTEASKPPKKKLPGWVIIPIVAVFVIIVVVASQFSKGNKKDTAAALQVTDVATGNIKELYNASGKIESEDTKTYYSPVTAPIQKNNAVVGNTVKAGELLISFDTTNLERDNQQAQLNLQSSLNASAAAKAQNAKAIDAANAVSAQAAEQANKLADKVNELAGQIQTVEQTIKAAQEEAGKTSEINETKRNELQAQIDQQNAKLAEAQNAMNSASMTLESLADKAAVAKVKEEKDPNSLTDDEKTILEAYDKANTDYNTAQTDYNTVQGELNKATSELEAIVDPSVDESSLAELKAAYDAAYAEWEAAYAAASAPGTDASMSSAEMANLDVSDNLAELATLTPAELVEKGKEGMKADMNGVIASVGSADPTADTLQSNSATQGMAMFSIASMDKVRVKLEIPADDYEKMKIGNTATITVGDYEYTGKLTKVNKIATENAKGNPVIKAEIHIDNPDENLCIGATAKVKMTVAEAKNVLVVPTGVINTSSEGDFVYVIENGTVKAKPVELGTASTTQIEVTSGLKEGEQVVDDMNVDIKEGMKATPVQKQAESSDDN